MVRHLQRLQFFFQNIKKLQSQIYEPFMTVIYDVRNQNPKFI